MILILEFPRSRPPTMLTEHFVASIAAQTKANTGVTKDAAIFVHELQPLEVVERDGEVWWVPTADIRPAFAD